MPNMPAFIDANNVQPFINEDLREVLNTITYISKNENEATGYDANILPLMCKMYLDARQAKVLKAQQLPLARASEILLLALSKVGITALVDEATGYQDIRVKDALQEILNQYLLEDAKKYKVTFPLELYKQWFRLNDWEWKEP